jgi:hypothetical protein
MNNAIQAALALDLCSTQWRVTLRPHELEEFAAHCMSYNNATQENLLRLIHMVSGAVPPMQFGEGNPNNGQPCHNFVIGNEGSRVVYLNIPKGLAPKGRINYAALSDRLDTIARECQADEFCVVEDRDNLYSYRFWWD